ncbi:fimbrial protein [Serratia fonticola]|uniref:fimbrial protein n=1 Tax=Serratia fonticola TaxID=47917 RepID=UPI0015C5CF4B|nr:fimbrial protein [Serratia fonticola]MBC3378763.1 fimbrial protein [Serratia fonticola]NYA37963.1 fimbrial protein [Serratia fonticola]
MKLFSLLRLALLGSLFAGGCLPAAATCTRVSPAIDSGCDACGVGVGLGRINLTSTYLQPVGTPLGSSVFDFTSGVRYPDPNKVLYQCDASDVGQIFEVFATNGDDRVGGYYDLGAVDGNPNYFATYFPYVGIRLTHLDSGKVFTRNWQAAPITRYATVGNKIQVRVKDLSPIRADLIRISSLPGRGASNYCGYSASNPLTGMASTTGNSNYTCIQPNGYVTFQGPGIASDPIGSDSATNYSTWGTGRWNAMGMGTSPISSLSYTATCVARNVTPLVLLPTLSVGQLTSGRTSQAQFTINIECDNAAVSGISTNRTALGLQVPYASFALAQQLGLVNTSGGVSYLLSDGYGTDSSVATGVGIALSNSSNGTPMNFVGWARCSAGQCPQGNNAGWYPVLDGASNGGSTATGYTHYTTQLTATLSRLPGQTVTAGKVDAKAYVWVKVQ